MGGKYERGHDPGRDYTSPSHECGRAGSGVPVFEASKNTLDDTATALREASWGNGKPGKKGHPRTMPYAFTTPPILGPSTLRLDRTATSQHSDAGSVASPDSTITRGIKETEAIRIDFGYGMEQLKQVQTKLTQENTDHVQRAEVLMMGMEELRKEVNEIKMEGRANQGKIETTMATVKDLTENRISVMTAIMAQREKQADERLKCMSGMMHRRVLDVDKRMVDLMTTVQDLILGVKTLGAGVPSSPSPVAQALGPAKGQSTSAFPTQQSTYREVAQRQLGIKPSHTKQPRIQPPATYKKVPDEIQVSTANHVEMQRCDISDPPSFDPYAKGASTTGDYYSAASGQRPNDTRTASGGNEYQTAVSSIPGTKRLALSYNDDQPRPLASSTQKKLPREST